MKTKTSHWVANKAETRTQKMKKTMKVTKVRITPKHPRSVAAAFSSLGGAAEASAAPLPTDPVSLTPGAL